MPHQHKRVSFGEYVKVKVIASRSELSAEELSRISFSPLDLKRFRKRERRLSEQLTLNGRLLASDDDTTGLYSFDAKSQRKQRVVDGLLSVLVEQELQCDDNGFVDHDCIAQSYSRTVNGSRLLARHRALKTEMQIEKSAKRETSSRATAHSRKLKIPKPNLMRWVSEIADSALVPISQPPLSPPRIRSSNSKMVVILLDDIIPPRCME